MSNYSDHDPKGWCGDPSRGAALGRPSVLGLPQGVVTVRHSPLDRQGYDRNGTYFGHGAPLFWYSDEEGNIDSMERGADAEDVARELRERDGYGHVQVGEPLALPCFGAGEDPCPEKANADIEYGWDLCEYCEWTEQETEEGDDEISG
jgi:hypothetical protein